MLLIASVGFTITMIYGLIVIHIRKQLPSNINMTLVGFIISYIILNFFEFI